MTDGTSRVIVGPATGYPYPPTGTHVSAVAYKRPGWVSLSIVGNPAGQGVLDQELVLADTTRAARCAAWRTTGAGPAKARPATGPSRTPS